MRIFIGIYLVLRVQKYHCESRESPRYWRLPDNVYDKLDPLVVRTKGSMTRPTPSVARGSGEKSEL